MECLHIYKTTTEELEQLMQTSVNACCAPNKYTFYVISGHSRKKKIPSNRNCYAIKIYGQFVVDINCILVNILYLAVLISIQGASVDPFPSICFLHSWSGFMLPVLDRPLISFVAFACDIGTTKGALKDVLSQLFQSCNWRAPCYCFFIFGFTLMTFYCWEAVLYPILTVRINEPSIKYL